MFNLNYTQIPSPLDQFEIRNLLSLDAPILGNLHIFLTNIGLYLIIAGLLILTLSVLTTNYNKIVSNNWSISQEAIYTTIHSIVTSQINPRNGQIYFPFIYALFIFILVNNLVGLVKRSLCINNNIFIAVTKKTNISPTTLKQYQTRAYSTSSTYKSSCYNIAGNNTYSLNPYYITGFTDAEGCFTISILIDSRMSTKWKVKPIFSISLHNKDIKILKAIQRTWGVGKIYKHGQNSVAYRVSSLKNLKVIINHFDKYPLITQKFSDYLLFKQSVALIENKQHLNMEGLTKLVSLKASLNLGLPEKLQEFFPNIVAAVKPEVKRALGQEIADIYWFIGFVEGEGCFMVVVQESKSKTTTHNISLSFTISQHIRDSVLFYSLIKYLGCGRCNSLSRKEVYFVVSKFSDIWGKIIPLFNRYSLIGTKKEDYLDFVKVAELILSKHHLTKEGLDKINIIRSNMNSKRIHP